MKKTIIISVLLVIFFSNIPFFDFLLQENYTYSNSDATFTYNEEGGKGKSFEGCQRRYGYFLCQHPDEDQGDNQLYRTFTIKPWRFWEWREMIFESARFKLPYLEPKSLK